MVLTGITDSSFVLLVAGSCDSPTPAMLFISFVPATLVALEVKWTPSPAQMLVLSTVASSCKGDSSGHACTGNKLFVAAVESTVTAGKTS